MALPYPSAQSFFRREIPFPEPARREKTLTIPGDAFTEADIKSTLDPLNRTFSPSREYVTCDICTLVPGPQAVTFVGRVVNFSTVYGRSKSHAAAKGWHHMIVKDDTGAISVKLYFISKTYDLKLGLLVTLWTPHIGNATKNPSLTATDILVTTSIFPGREASVHIVLHQNSDVGNTCRLPLEYGKGQHMNVMTIKSFIDGGNELRDKKILVCVKSIGAQRNISTKKGTKLELTEVKLFDDTGEIMLKLWGDIGLSAKDWRPSGTILLFSNPSFRLEYHGASIGVTHTTIVDVNPEFPDAGWLRKYAASKIKKESVDQTFPDIWDVDATVTGKTRIFFTLADVDEFVREEPSRVITGFISVVIMDMSLVVYFRRNMLMCTQCCGLPIYDNSQTYKCQNCDKELKLRLNPKIIGPLVDETGSIDCGKILWSDKAWEDLFGRTADELISDDGQIVSLLEQRMKYMRITLVFGWSDEVGKLAALAVLM